MADQPVTEVKYINNPDLPGPPNYPPTQNYPDEYWRKNPAGDPDNKQIQVVEKGWSGGHGGEVEVLEVEPGWDKPVSFFTDLNDDGVPDSEEDDDEE